MVVAQWLHFFTSVQKGVSLNPNTVTKLMDLSDGHSTTQLYTYSAFHITYKSLRIKETSKLLNAACLIFQNCPLRSCKQKLLRYIKDSH